jgi:hypothetical protein
MRGNHPLYPSIKYIVQLVCRQHSRRIRSQCYEQSGGQSACARHLSGRKTSFAERAQETPICGYTNGKVIFIAFISTRAKLEVIKQTDSHT